MAMRSSRQLDHQGMVANWQESLQRVDIALADSDIFTDAAVPQTAMKTNNEINDRIFCSIRFTLSCQRTRPVVVVVRAMRCTRACLA